MEGYTYLNNYVSRSWPLSIHADPTRHNWKQLEHSGVILIAQTELN